MAEEMRNDYSGTCGVTSCEKRGSLVRVDTKNLKNLNSPTFFFLQFPWRNVWMKDGIQNIHSINEKKRRAAKSAFKERYSGAIWFASQLLCLSRTSSGMLFYPVPGSKSKFKWKSLEDTIKIWLEKMVKESFESKIIFLTRLSTQPLTGELC